MNIEHIKKWYAMLRHEQESEFRAISLKGEAIITEHFFGETQLIELVKKWEGKRNLYVGVNERSKGGTKAEHITKVKVIPLDIDCIAKPANQEDLTLAMDVTTKILSDAEKFGYKKPMLSFSGNGYQVYFSIPEVVITHENREEITQKIQYFEQKMIMKYSTDKVRLDNVGDLPRIMRVSGTFNMKSQTESNLILDTFEEDYRLRDDILNIKISSFKTGVISEEIKEKISGDKEIMAFMEGNLQGKASRSEAEMSLVCRLVRVGLEKDKIFSVMSNCKLGKWQEASISYRELTYKKAIALVTEEKDMVVLIKGEARKFFGRMGQAQEFAKKQPIYFDEAGLFWVWTECEKCWKMIDEITLENELFKEEGIDTVNSSIRSEIIQALKQVGRMSKPKDFPKNWIQFKEVIINLDTGEESKATPEYFCINPLAYKMNKERYMLTPTMDKLFEEWVGKAHVQTLYEIIAFSCLTDYPLHRLFCFIGGGLNGKSCYMRVLRKFLGADNVTSTDLDTLLNSRFEVTKLYKKLACMMGETNFNQLSQTSLIKKLTGQDFIGFEYKNKTPFDGENYAKILIATNNLPETTDKTDGFYRRWLIIDFPNQFDEGRDVVADIPEEEYECLAVKIPFLIKDLMTNRKFTGEGSIEDRKQAYEDKSNPFDKFWKNYVDDSDLNAYITKWDFSKRYNGWAKDNHFREISDEGLGEIMKKRGIATIQPSIEWYQNDSKVKRQVRSWAGVRWK